LKGTIHGDLNIVPAHKHTHKLDIADQLEKDLINNFTSIFRGKEMLSFGLGG